MKATKKQISHILENMVNIEIEQDNEIKDEHYIDGLLESLEFVPIYKEGIKIYLSEYIEIEFTFDELNEENNCITSLTFEGEELDVDYKDIVKIENKLYKNVKL